MPHVQHTENDDLYAMRHSCAHLMAAAVMELDPDAKFGVGPVIENGFFYDMLLSAPLIPEDLPRIEERMKEIRERNDAYERSMWKLDDAVQYFTEHGQNFKVELLRDLKTKGTTVMNDLKEMEETLGDTGVNEVSVYTTGTFVDLCRGPHVRRAKEIGSFKLLSIAGAYWRGKAENPQLVRVYGTCFKTKKELDVYLWQLEEAKKRDHRKIGQEQQLFFIDETVGKGLAMWLPKGLTIRNEIEKLAVEMENKDGYARVATPHLAKEALFLKSGHLPYYKESMYPAMVMDDGTYYLKAMNCPHHHIIYNHTPHSYRELPLRIAEYGTVYRNELSGTLAGLLRVRGMSMNDAHIYCRRDQIESEFKRVMQLTMRLFEIFGLKDYWFRLSLWSAAHTEKYINEPENWEYAEGILRAVLEEVKVSYVEAKDEAAFYGPKVDVMFKSVLGREETMSTIQLDFAAKKRFELAYTDETGAHNNEVFVIHRAPLSTHERFMAFLIEHYAGVWPVWLSPVQVKLLPVGEKHREYAGEMQARFMEAGIRAAVDMTDETVGKKIRNAEHEKVPYMLVIGDKEASGGPLAVRSRWSKDTVNEELEKFIARAQKEIADRV
ncbi:MAG: threonine--tRNA ligase [Candidatus Magasanikbacteria bacterium]|nr:threonine--tRNA ligase [Candidatus Magasanikbacteria bacterium]